MPKLGVNIDHVATLREARGETTPDPILAAQICEKAGAHSIVAHLREDRRHINDLDVLKLKKAVTTRLNLEMSIHPEIVRIAVSVKPHQTTLVPEKRQELTTEGGLDVTRQFSRIKRAVTKLQDENILVSLFVDPIKKQIKSASKTGAAAIELHTGCYANAKSRAAIRRELRKLKEATHYGWALGLTVHAGHGLNYRNTTAVASIKGIEELNIGHSIISHAVFVGLNQAVKDMLKLAR